MAVIRGMMACSLDGFAADAQGGVGWLAQFEVADWGYGDFIAQIGTVVMGRKTYAHMLTLTPEWPYAGRRAYVLGQGLQAPLRGNALIWDGGLPGLVSHLRRLSDGDVWVVGGPTLQGALIAMGALDRLELCVVPHLLGQGLRVFPDVAASHQPQLAGIRALPLGMVMLDYRFGAAERGARGL